MFLHKGLYILPLFRNKIGALHRKNFFKTFTFCCFLSILLVLTVDKIFYISYKYQPPNNLTKHQYFYTRDFIYLLHFETQLAISMASFF